MYMINNSLVAARIIWLMVASIYLQQVCVINIGGSFKLYELLALVLLIVSIPSLLKFEKIRIPHFSFIFLLVFFIFSPWLPLVIRFVVNPETEYYIKYPEADNVLRFNIVFSAVFTYVYYVLCWVVVKNISTNDIVVGNTKRYIRLYVYVGCFVALYAIYSSFFVNLIGFPDLIPSVIDFRNSKPSEQFRPSGFSAEPGIYIYMLGWMLIFLITNAVGISYKLRLALSALTFFVIILTSSSQIVSVLFVFFLYVVLYSSKKVKVAALLIIFLVLSILSTYFVDSGLSNQINYILFEKLANFFSSPTHTLDSGAFRSYTARIGFAIFTDYPWGIGAGLSYFYMSNYEHMMGILSWGERLTFSSAPQNAHSMVLAELGAFGYLFLLLFFVSVFIAAFRFDRKYMDPLARSLVLGLPMVYLMLMSIYPISSIYIWLPIALCLTFFRRRHAISSGR